MCGRITKTLTEHWLFILTLVSVVGITKTITVPIVGVVGIPKTITVPFGCLFILL
jgi:hypothetical protein